MTTSVTPGPCAGEETDRWAASAVYSVAEQQGVMGYTSRTVSGDCGAGGGGSGGFFNLNQKWFENLRSLKNILKFLFSGGTAIY